jgi:hypothetical protein
MYKSQTNKAKVIQYIFIIPFFFLLLTAFRKNADLQQIVFSAGSFGTGSIGNKPAKPVKENIIHQSQVPLNKPVKQEPKNAGAPTAQAAEINLEQIPAAQPQNTSANSATDKLLVVFDETTTKEKLAASIEQVKTFGANLSFEDEVYNEEGTLLKAVGVLTFPQHPRMRGTFNHSIDKPSYIKINKVEGTYSFGLGAHVKRPVVHL